MNERIIIRLTDSKRHLPINSLSKDGVMLRNETDATPRGLLFEFDGATEATKVRMERVRKLRDWRLGEFNLDINLIDGNLVFTGVDTRSLPPGKYWCRLRIADLKLPKGKISIDLKEDGEVVKEIAVEKDKRDIELIGEIASFDSELKRVLEATASRLDGSAASGWLSDTNPRAARKACVLNLLAKLRTVPTTSKPLINHLQHIFFADVDRVYGRVDRDFFTRLDELARDPQKPFFDEGSPKSAGHRRLLDRIARFEGQVETYRLVSYRQEGKNSMQAVIAIPSDPSRNFYADLDIDLGNPLQDVVGFVIHLGELINPGKTDHLALRAQLEKTKSLAPFLMYKVIQAK